MAVMVLAIFARNVFDLPIPVLIILAIGAFIALIGDRNEIIALIICCIPMSAAFQYKYLIFICILLYALKFMKDIRFSFVVFPLAFMMVWELLHAFEYAFSAYTFLRNFAELIFCAFLMMVLPQAHKKINYPMICRLLAITSVCMMSIVLLNLLKETNYNFEEIFFGTYRFGVGDADTKNYGVNYNANGLGEIANLSILGLLQLVSIKKHNIFDYLLIIALTLFGVMTMSRTFLVCFALIFVMFAVSGTSTAVAKVKRIFGIILLVALLIILVYQIMPDVFERFVDRFKVADITNGRADLLGFYGEHIASSFKHSFFGVGLQDYGVKVNNIYKTAMDVCHNGTEEVVVCWGIPGLMLFAWFIVEMFRHKALGFRRCLANYMPLLLILVFVQAGQLISSGISLLSLSFAYVSLIYNFKERQNNE
ncbi:MAG: hypothetical protein E7641_01475 [Ruminococcaceae bacterium]|nr:hypothetical protein [Oscillospiraceae bacterium]